MNQNTQEVKNECFLTWTRQNKVQILGKQIFPVALDLCEGGSFSPTIFKSDIELSVYHISCFISVCPLVALSKAKFAENLHFVFCLVHMAYIKKRSFLTSCVVFDLFP